MPLSRSHMFMGVCMRTLCLLLVIWLCASVPVFSADRTSMIIAAQSAPNTPWDLNWQDVQAAFDAAGDIGLDMQLLVRGETGNSDERLTALRRNRVQYVSAPIGTAAAILPELSVLQLPYLFDAAEEFDFV
ncbi:uncharacterized protein METZ01_LOCUS414987, partial [marine metagenome]